MKEWGNKVLPQIGNALLVLLCVASWGGGYLYLLTPSLTMLRVITIVSVVVLMVMQHKQQPSVYYYVLLFFLLYILHTTLVSFPNKELVTAGRYYDFFTVGLLVFTLITLAFQNCRQSLFIFYLLCIVYVPLLSIIGCIEYVTDWHLPFSRSAALHAHDPCGASYNPNDYSTLIAMALIYVHAYRRKFVQNASLLIDYIYAAMVCIVFLMTKCRTALLIEILFLVFMNRRLVKKYWKILAALAAAALGVMIFFWRKDPSIWIRVHLSIDAFNSLFDSYGMGYGVMGDRHFFLMQDNRDRFGGITNSHSYLLQILLTSGIVIFTLYCILLFYLMRIMSKGGRNEFWIMPVFYILLMFSPSSSLFLWGQYLMFAFFVCYAGYVVQNEKTIICR